MLPLLVLIAFIVGIQTLAGKEIVPSPDAMLDAIQQAREIQIESAKLIENKSINNIIQKDSTHKGCSSQNFRKGKNAKKGCVKNIAPQLSNDNKATQILVFVSFSMPEASLKSLFQETQQHNAVLVMRGLYQDSFVKTAQKLQDLRVTIDINPELFEAYNIASVPTIVLLKDSQFAYSLKGNVTLEFAIQKFNDQQLKEKVS